MCCRYLSISVRNLFLIVRDIESLRENNQTQNKDPWRAERFLTLRQNQTSTLQLK